MNMLTRGKTLILKYCTISIRLSVQKYFHPRSYQVLRMWFVVFCLNQIGVHDNQLMLWPRKWYSTGYTAIYINCTVLHCRKLYTFPYFPSFLVIIKWILNVRHTQWILQFKFFSVTFIMAKYVKQFVPCFHEISVAFGR